METRELKFSDGLVQFSVNDGKAVVTFNPTDSAFVEKLFNAFDTLDQRQERYKAEADKIADKREIFSIARNQDAEMREIMDGVFDKPISSDVFGTMNVYAMADGLPVWCNFLLAVMDEVDGTFAREQKATNPRVQKYTAKYKR